jgi:hypothetical protein
MSATSGSSSSSNSNLVDILPDHVLVNVMKCLVALPSVADVKTFIKFAGTCKYIHNLAMEHFPIIDNVCLKAYITKRVFFGGIALSESLDTTDKCPEDNITIKMAIKPFAKVDTCAGDLYCLAERAKTWCITDIAKGEDSCFYDNMKPYFDSLVYLFRDTDKFEWSCTRHPMNYDQLTSVFCGSVPRIVHVASLDERDKFPGNYESFQGPLEELIIRTAPVLPGSQRYNQLMWSPNEISSRGSHSQELLESFAPYIKTLSIDGSVVRMESGIIETLMLDRPYLELLILGNVEFHFPNYRFKKIRSGTASNIKHLVVNANSWKPFELGPAVFGKLNYLALELPTPELVLDVLENDVAIRGIKYLRLNVEKFTSTDSTRLARVLGSYVKLETLELLNSKDMAYVKRIVDSYPKLEIKLN